MGNIQGTGSFDASVANNADSSNLKKKEQSEFEKALEKEKQKFKDLLQFYLYHINLAILEHSFKLKNEEMLSKINRDLSEQTAEIKKKEEAYSSKMRDFKHLSKNNDYKKTVNIIMFYMTLLSVIALMVLIGYSIYIK
jgi:hypothetical protein